ncbi:MAG: hypothetical protein OCU22_02380 [Canidatus Methanoxibalbensis ujae]|nr:hypothetical protein [Candidatus Methanoxibalbensis ujae]
MERRYSPSVSDDIEILFGLINIMLTLLRLPLRVVDPDAPLSAQRNGTNATAP